MSARRRRGAFPRRFCSAVRIAMSCRRRARSARAFHLRLWERPGRGPDGVGKVGERTSVQGIGFGQLAGGFGKVAGLAGIGHYHRQTCCGGGGHHRTLEASGGLQHNEHRVHQGVGASEPIRPAEGPRPVSAGLDSGRCGIDPSGSPGTHDVKLEQLRFYRAEIQHEFNLLSTRVSAYITSQSFLVIGFTLAMSHSNPHWGSLFRLIFPPALALLGVATSRMAEENPSWGYRRLQGALANLGHRIDAGTVRNILHRYHLGPAPQRRKAGMTSAQSLTLHWEVLAATDFFTVEVATWHGLVTYDVLFVMDLARRQVEVAGMTPHPPDEFMRQCARRLTDHFDGFLRGKRFLIHDRDAKFTRAFDGLLKEHRVEPVLLPPRSPNLNAYCERFVRSIKEEALEHMRMLGERSLHYVVRQYLAHSHQERNHQELSNRPIMPEPGIESRSGRIARRDRLGGLLSYYYRDAA
jgi:transposase InsO family protein